MSANARAYVINEEMVRTDVHGYLIDHNEWSQDLAQVIAQTEGIELTSEHWDVLYYLRTHYIEYAHSPNVRLLIKVLSKAWGRKRGGKKRLYTLFPAGPARQGCKIAGLPLPNDCIDWE